MHAADEHAVVEVADAPDCVLLPVTAQKVVIAARVIELLSRVFIEGDQLVGPLRSLRQRFNVLGHQSRQDIVSVRVVHVLLQHRFPVVLEVVQQLQQVRRRLLELREVFRF